MPTRAWQREIDLQEARPAQLERDLLFAREHLSTIRRMCAAAGIDTRQLSAVEAVRQLAREHVARGAMNLVLHRQQEGAAKMYTSEPLPGIQSVFEAGGRYYADAEDARRARIELEKAGAPKQARLEVAAFGAAIVAK